MNEYESTEGLAYRDIFDIMDSERPIPEFGPCGTLGRWPRPSLYGVPPNVISTLLTYRRMSMGLEMAALEIALRTGGLAYSDNGPYTCFVPSEKAFVLLSQAYAENLFRDQNKLMRVLKNHTVRGRLMLNDIRKAVTVKSLADKHLKVNESDGVSIGGAKILYPDILAGNGVIHIIDTVLID